MWEKYGDQPVLVYGLHGGESPKLLADFVEQAGLTVPILKGQGTLWQINVTQGAGYPYPRDVIMDKKGVIRSAKITFDIDEASALIQTLLAE